MNNLNSIILEGNLTKDPDFKKTPKGTPVCRFTVASNRYYKSENGREKEVGYFEVEVWSRLAETCGEYLNKGRGVRVVGRIRQDRWTGTDGTLNSRIRIIGEHVEFQNRPQSAASNNQESIDTEKKPSQEAIPAY